MTRMSKPELTCEVKLQYLQEQAQAPQRPYAIACTVSIRWMRIDTPRLSMRGPCLCMTEHAYPFEATAPEFALAYAGALH